VPVPTRQARNKKLRILSLKKQRAHYEKFVGVTKPVLVESAESEGLRFGYTPEYVRVSINDSESTPNTTTDIYLNKINPDGYVSGLIKKS
jgi:threonylcarbamoyladenosine tRNA methylthiotransferase MtaB